jgi:hypothetical protein
MLQLTDVRSPNNFKTTFQVTVDDGFFISVNEPADVDKKVFTRVGADEPGLFQNIGLQGPTTYTSTQPCSFYSSTPNMMKIYFEDAGGGWNALKMTALDSTAKQTLVPSNFSLTCERNAPFLNFEVDRVSSEFRELRNPDMFSQFCIFKGFDVKNRSDDQNITPGKRGYVRLNSARSSIGFRNIAFQSWKTMTFAVRFTTMPVKATFFSMASGQPGSGPYCCMVAYRNGGRIRMSFEYRDLTGTVREKDAQTFWDIRLNDWYYFVVQNTGTTLRFNMLYMEGAQKYDMSYGTSFSVALDNNGGFGRSFYGYNATWNPAPGQAQEACDIGFGTALYPGWASMYNDTVFNYDIAWVHFFDYAASNTDLKRDANSDWIYTQFPKKLNTY